MEWLKENLQVLGFIATSAGSALYVFRKFINIERDIKEVKGRLTEHIQHDDTVMEEIKERLKTIESDIKQLLSR